jgi:hypothetical protein
MTATSQKKKNPRPKHIPQRTCVGCRQTKPKRELIRIVRTEGGSAEIDPTGKRSGRGTYLCKAKGCWEAGLKKERLDRALRTKINPENRRELALYGETFP